jgi:hypothetical protein
MSGIKKLLKKNDIPFTEEEKGFYRYALEQEDGTVYYVLFYDAAAERADKLVFMGETTFSEYKKEFKDKFPVFLITLLEHNSYMDYYKVVEFDDHLGVQFDFEYDEEGMDFEFFEKEIDMMMQTFKKATGEARKAAEK